MKQIFGNKNLMPSKVGYSYGQQKKPRAASITNNGGVLPAPSPRITQNPKQSNSPSKIRQEPTDEVEKAIFDL